MIAEQNSDWKGWLQNNKRCLDLRYEPPKSLCRPFDSPYTLYQAAITEAVAASYQQRPYVER